MSSNPKYDFDGYDRVQLPSQQRAPMRNSLSRYASSREAYNPANQDHEFTHQQQQHPRKQVSTRFHSTQHQSFRDTHRSNTQHARLGPSFSQATGSLYRQQDQLRASELIFEQKIHPRRRNFNPDQLYQQQHHQQDGNDQEYPAKYPQYSCDDDGAHPYNHRQVRQIGSRVDQISWQLLSRFGSSACRGFHLLYL